MLSRPRSCSAASLATAARSGATPRALAIAGLALLLCASWAGPAQASHFRGGALVPSVDSSGLLTVVATTFWRPTAVGCGEVTASLTAGGAAMTKVGGDTLDTSDGRFTACRQTFQSQLPGAGAYVIRAASCCRVAGIRNAAASSWDLVSNIVWNGTSAATPFQFNFAAIQVEVGRDRDYVGSVGAVPGAGITLTYDQVLNLNISSQPPGFTIDPNTGAMFVPQASAATWLDNFSGNAGADYAFSGNIHGSDGSSVEFDWLFDAVDVGPETILAPEVDNALVIAEVGDFIQFQATGVDPNPAPVGPLPLSWDFPAFLGVGANLAPAFDPTSQVFTWDTLGSLVGTYGAQFRANNGSKTDIGTLTIHLVDAFDPFSGMQQTPTPSVDLHLIQPAATTSGVRCVEATDPAMPDFSGVPFEALNGGPLDLPFDLSPGGGAKTVCCEYQENSGQISEPICASIQLSSISLAPTDAQLPLGDTLTLTATVTEQNGAGPVPAVGETVTFEVVSGPNLGATGMDTTDANGEATFDHSSIVPGRDRVEARFTDGQGAAQRSNLASIIWGDGTVRFPAAGWGEAVQVYDDAPYEFLADLATEAEKLVFFAAQTDGVYILDVTDRFEIAVLAHYHPSTCDANGVDVPFFADDVFFVEAQSVMHVAAAACGVQVVDVFDPTEPTLLSTYARDVTGAEAVDVYVGGAGAGGPCAPDAVALAYVAGLDSFEVYDVSDPAAPMHCASLATTDPDLGPGPIVAVDFYATGDGESEEMAVAVATGDGARKIDVDDPATPFVAASYGTPPAFGPYRISQHIRVDDDVEFGMLSSWVAGFQVITTDDDTAVLIAHEPTDSAFFGADECNGAVCGAEGQIGLTRMLPEDTGAGIDLVRIDESDEAGEQSLPVGPPGAFAWDVEVDACEAFVTFGVFQKLCMGGENDGAKCGDASECGAESACSYPGGFDIIPLPDCGEVQLEEEPPSADADADGVPDGLDNCSAVANDQTDADLDGYGDACDADLNNDGVVGVPDFAILVRGIGKPGAAGDLNGDGVVGSPDFALLMQALGTAPGPSGLACAGAVPCP